MQRIKEEHAMAMHLDGSGKWRFSGRKESWFAADDGQGGPGVFLRASLTHADESPIDFLFGPVT